MANLRGKCSVVLLQEGRLPFLLHLCHSGRVSPPSIFDQHQCTVRFYWLFFSFFFPSKKSWGGVLIALMPFCNDFALVA